MIWDKAHDIVMSEEGADCAWVHAYLHRVEGDRDNARYWYRQARREPARASLRRNGRRLPPRSCKPSGAEPAINRRGSSAPSVGCLCLPPR